MTDGDCFALLKGLLEPYAASLIVKHDEPGNFYLEEPGLEGKRPMFGAVQAKKSYTALHLFPLYTHPELLDDVTPALKARMQGKSCFNFKRAEQIPQEELDALIRRAFATR